MLLGVRAVDSASASTFPVEQPGLLSTYYPPILRTRIKTQPATGTAFGSVSAKVTSVDSQGACSLGVEGAAGDKVQVTSRSGGQCT